MVKIKDLLFHPTRVFPTDSRELFNVIIWQFVVWMLLGLLSFHDEFTLNMGFYSFSATVSKVLLIGWIMSSLFIFVLSLTTQLGLILLKKNHDYISTFNVSVYSSLVFSFYWLIAWIVTIYDLFKYGAEHGIFNKIYWFVAISHTLIIQIVGIKQSHNLDMKSAVSSVMFLWVIVLLLGIIAFSVKPEEKTVSDDWEIYPWSEYAEGYYYGKYYALAELNLTPRIFFEGKGIIALPKKKYYFHTSFYLTNLLNRTLNYKLIISDENGTDYTPTKNVAGEMFWNDSVMQLNERKYDWRYIDYYLKDESGLFNYTIKIVDVDDNSIYAEDYFALNISQYNH